MSGLPALEFKPQTPGGYVPRPLSDRVQELRTRSLDPEILFEEARTETFNTLLRNHVVQADDWQHRELAEFLHDWVERFTSEFRLEIDSPAIRICPLRNTTLGHYHPGRNQFGLRHEVAINRRRLARPIADVLLTLFHELLHEWQAQHGKPGRGNYHNKEFRKKAAYFGISIDARGHTRGVEDGLFVRLLLKYGVDGVGLFVSRGQPVDATPTGSKLKKWSCGCTNVRCAVALVARCLLCGNRFEPAQAAW
jgi:hypothetical protein